MAIMDIMRFISYSRVSTDEQGRSGLGLEAQRATVAAHVAAAGAALLAEYVEVESGGADDRPELARALAHARRTGATLIVAKLDRLSRNQSFLMRVYEGTGEGGVVFCDLPTIPAGPVGKFIVQQMAAVAELERGLISARTKAALAAARARGVVLGGYRGAPPPPSAAGVAARRRAAQEHAGRLADIVRPMRDAGATLQVIADRLAAEGVRAAGGGSAWTATAVRRVLARL
jgi:DNA invertase Pin-like site-specific DNA recombinase